EAEHGGDREGDGLHPAPDRDYSVTTSRPCLPLSPASARQSWKGKVPARSGVRSTTLGRPGTTRFSTRKAAREKQCSPSEGVRAVLTVGSSGSPARPRVRARAAVARRAALRLLEQGLAGEADLARRIDADHLHQDLVPLLHLAAHVLHAVMRHLRDVKEAVRP